MHLQITTSDVAAEEYQRVTPVIQDEMQKAIDSIITYVGEENSSTGKEPTISRECTSDEDDTSMIIFSGDQNLEFTPRACKSDHAYMYMYVIYRYSVYTCACAYILYIIT